MAMLAHSWLACACRGTPTAITRVLVAWVWRSEPWARHSPSPPRVHSPSPPRVPTSPTCAPQLHCYPLQSQQQYPIHSPYSANAVIVPNNPPLFPPTQEANAVTDPITGQVQEYRHLIKGPTKDIWVKSFANKIGRFAQGVGTQMPTGTDTIFFIQKQQVPDGRKVMYGHIASQTWKPKDIKCNSLWEEIA
jgi:hypothetical protein